MPSAISEIELDKKMYNEMRKESDSLEIKSPNDKNKRPKKYSFYRRYKLRLARLRIGMHQCEVADRCGIARITLSMYERYDRFATPANAWTLIDFYANYNIKLTLEDFYPKFCFVVVKEEN
ncbi:MAG: helix-turn-helix transcriptional regulator [Saprospiraceae bacterium]|nr:helix-turn-helix transcriptional regulator [Saprospiraceae bacterium]